MVTSAQSLPFGLGAYPLGVMSNKASFSYSSMPGSPEGLTFKLKDGSETNIQRQYAFGRVSPYMGCFCTTTSNRLTYAIVTDSAFIDDIDKFMQIITDKHLAFTYPDKF